MKTQDNLIGWANRPKKMSDAKIRAFLKEFPGVKENVYGPIWEVYVTYAEEGILAYKPYVTFFDLYWPGVSEKIMLITKDHKIPEYTLTLTRGRFPSVMPPKRTLRIPAIASYFTRVEDAIRGMSDEQLDSVQYLLSYHPYTKAVIVYKFPKGMTLKTWLESVEQAEREKFRKEPDTDTEDKLKALE